MLSERQVVLLPAWAEKCRRTTISKLLQHLASPLIRHVMVRFYQERAYIVLMEQFSPTYKKFGYYVLPQRHWASVYHVINMRPLRCPCWICIWRRRRQRFLEPSMFDHLFKQYK